jgi:hypothetical protein
MSRAIFDIYSKNFKMVMAKKWPDISVLEPIYPCPLCGFFFGEHQLDTKKSPHLTIEHVPPEAIGGKPLILTCNKCNSKDGYTLDAEIKKRVRFSAVNTGHERISTKYTLNDSMRIDGLIGLDEKGNLSSDFDPKRTNPKNLENLLSLLKTEGAKGKLNFTLYPGQGERVKLSLLRTAYLSAFWKMGFGYALCSSSIELARIIHNKELPGEFQISLNAALLPELNKGIYYICKPTELQSFLVVFTQRHKSYEERRAIILPACHDKSLEIYLRAYELRNSKNVNIEVAPLFDLDYVGNPDNCLLPVSFSKIYS